MAGTCDSLSALPQGAFFHLVVRTLLFEKPVSRLLPRVRSLPRSEQQQFWRAYRVLRRQVRQEPLTPTLCGHQLQLQLAQGTSYAVVSLALKLAQAYTWQWFGARGAKCRAKKALAHEFFHLVRRHLRHALGLRALPSPLRWSYGAEQVAGPCAGAWHAVCDGSHKTSISSAGIVVRDPQGNERAEVAVTVPAGTAVYAELWACIRTLQTLHLFGAKNVELKVDSLSVIRALEGRLPLRYSVEEAELQYLLQDFEKLEVEVVPRVETYRADALAASVSAH